MGKEEKKEKKEEEKKIITAIYKVNLHCPQCARDIKKPLLKTPGVHSVDVKFEKNEVTVKGIIDEKKIHKKLEKISRRNVEIVKPKETVAKEVVKEIIEKKVTETKEKAKGEIKVQTTTIKVFLHCKKCEYDLRTRLLKKKGIHNVKTDMKAQTIAIEGTVESKKLLAYMKKVHRHAEIVPPKEEKKEKEKEKVEVKKTTETTKIVEFKEETKVGTQTGNGDVPYFVHYVYAPQMFSDENPNACSIM